MTGSFGLWALDASMGVRDGAFCFCPVELDADGNIENVVTGLTVVSDQPPRGGQMIAVVHQDGQRAVEDFCAEHKAEIDRLFLARVSNQIGEPK